MAATLLDGKALAKELRAEMQGRVEAWKARGVTPHLVVVLVGEDPASAIYVRNKHRACEEIGMRSTVTQLPADTTQEALEQALLDLNDDPLVHGILLQLPVPEHLDEARLLELIHPDKDVDGFHAINAGRLFSGLPGLVPCTPQGAMALIEKSGVDLSGKEAVVVGRSNIVGKPMAILLMNQNATVTICHSRTKDLAGHCRRADILVAAIGRANFITGDMVKPGAVVVDVGINRVDGKVVGDVERATVEPVAGYLTPVPGGVGPMTITMLLHNTLEAVARQV